MRNVICSVFTVILVVVFIGCSTPNGSDVSSASITDTTNPKSSTKVTTVVKRIGPKMGLQNTKSVSLSGSLRNLRGIPNTDNYIITNDFDPCHRADIAAHDWDATKAQLASPVFDGFEYVQCADGDTYTSTAYGKKLTTIASVTDEKTIFHGKYNDGGGYYNLIINKDGSYSFEQLLILDVVLLNTDVSYTDPGYLDTIRRELFFNRCSGKIIISADGVLTSTGAGEQYRMEFMPGMKGAEKVYSEHDIDFAYWNFWSNCDVFYSTFATRSSPGYFVMKNSIDDLWFNCWSACHFIDYSDQGTVSVTYGSQDIINKLKNVTSELPFDNSGSTPYYNQRILNNYVNYKLKGEWKTLFNTWGIDPTKTTLNDKSVLDLWWNYTDTDSVDAVKKAYQEQKDVAAKPVVTSIINSDGTTTTTTITTTVTDNGDGTITTTTTENSTTN